MDNHFFREIENICCTMTRVPFFRIILYIVLCRCPEAAAEVREFCLTSIDRRGV